MLADGQKAFFESFGYVLMRGLFSPNEMAAITDAAETQWLEARKDPSGKEPLRNGSLSEFIESQPVLFQLIEDDRIYGTISELLGPDFIWCGSEGNITSKTFLGFHPDRTGPAGGGRSCY